MAETIRRARNTQPQKSKLHEVDGVQVYARKDDAGRPSKVDAIDQDEGKIRDIADRLQRRGLRRHAPAKSAGRQGLSTSSRRPGPAPASRPRTRSIDLMIRRHEIHGDPP